MFPKALSAEQNNAMTAAYTDSSREELKLGLV